MASSLTPESPAGEAGKRGSAPPGNDLFGDALQGALALVHADGGEIAMFDPARAALLTRARATHPASHPAPVRLDGAGSHVAATALPSLQSLQPSTHADRHPDPASRARAGASGEIATQSTMVLHAGSQQRSYRLGEGLVGIVAQRREPMLVGRDEYRKLARGFTGADLDANWHMAVPIFRAGALASPHADTGLLGVISVYNRDPHWSFTDRDVELLALHADRVARALALEDVRWRARAESELMETLRGATSAQELFARARQAARTMLDAPSFAVARLAPSGNEVVLEAAERDGKTVAPLRVSLRSLPHWWQSVSQHRCSASLPAQERGSTDNTGNTRCWGGVATRRRSRCWRSRSRVEPRSTARSSPAVPGQTRMVPSRCRCSRRWRAR